MPGARTITAILPTGRIAWLRVDPALASAASVRHLGEDAEHAAHRRRARSESHREAIERIAHKLAAAVERVGEARVQRADALRQHLVKKQNARDRKLSKSIAEFRGRIDKQIALERESAKRLRRRGLWDQIVLATALPLFAAYGQRGQPFGVNNIALTLCTLVWLVGDDLMQALFGSDKKDPYPLRDADAWSYIAPIGNLLAGWWLMNDLQHERFVAGAADTFTLVDDPEDAANGRQRYRCDVDLSHYIGSGHFRDFQTYIDVPAAATLGRITLSAAGSAANARVDSVMAEVTGGTLRVVVLTSTAGALPVDPMVSKLQVAWMVDTAEPNRSSP